MKNIAKLAIALAVCASFSARQAKADVVFEEITSQSGMPMGGGGGGKTKVLISGDKYRAQKKLTIDAGAMGDSMKMSQQMSGVQMGMMNQMMRGGKPDYPDHIMTLDEWAEFDENKQLLDEVNAKSKKGKGLLGQLKKDFSRKSDKEEKTVEHVLQKYCSEFDYGVREKKKDEAAAKMAEEGGMAGMTALAQVADYDTWLRAKIIQDSCQNGNLGEVRKISDDGTPEYKELKRKYELKSEFKAEYARAKEKGKEMPGKMDNMMKEGMGAAAAAASDMMLNVQIVRLDTGKVIELFPPNKSKDPKPEDVTYKEESLDKLRDRLEDLEKKKQKMMKGSEGNMKEADAKMAAMRAKYGDQAIDQATGGKPAAKKLGNETVNGIPCEHWQVKGMSGVDDYWVSSKFPGAEEILAFEAKLKEQIGTGRSGLTFGGGAPDMGAMMGGVNPALQAEVARIKERGIVIKHVNTMKNAAPSQGSTLANQKMMAGDMGAHGAAQMASMKGMDMSALAKDPAAMQKMIASMGQQSGAAAQASAEKHQAAGDFKTGEQQDMVTTYELKLVGTSPVPAAAFEPPAGAKRK